MIMVDLRGCCKDDSYLIGSIDRNKMVKDLCASQNYHKMVFLTFTCNQKEHFIMKQLKASIDLGDCRKIHQVYDDLYSLEKKIKYNSLCYMPLLDWYLSWICLWYIQPPYLCTSTVGVPYSTVRSPSPAKIPVGRLCNRPPMDIVSGAIIRPQTIYVSRRLSPRTLHPTVHVGPYTIPPPLIEVWPQ